MKTKGAKGRGVSLPSDVWAQVDERIASLQPWVGGVSDYVRRLIALDLTHQVLNETGGPAVSAPKSELLGVSA